MTRLYSLLTVKRLDEHEREIEGIASTGETDRVGDIVEPMGLQAPSRGVSLLWQHAHDKPIGWATFDRPTAKGITFRAKLPKPTEPSPFRDLVEMAWGALVHATVRGVSIGFRALATEPLPAGGTRFTRAELLELSLVSVPANASATVTAIKRYANGGRNRVVRLDEPLTDRNGNVLWAPKKATHRVVKLDMPSNAPAENGGVMRAAEAAMEELFEAERLAAIAKKAGPGALPIRMVSEAARETDRELAAIRARIAKLEGKR
jgi:HK97 family phage prohead protease